MMIIDCIADLHGHYPQLEGGDLLIVAGDHTKRDSFREHSYFWHWLGNQKYKKQIFIAGNHDNWLQEHRPVILEICPNATYLCDSGTEFTIEEDDLELEMCGIHPTKERTFKIWGSPWTKTFEGMNPHCKAFTVDTDEELAQKWNLIPVDVDILITHSPPKYGLDRTIDQQFVGSKSLQEWIFIHQPKLHIFGHIHESFGIVTNQMIQELNRVIIGETNPNLCKTTIVNASHVNEYYQPVNKPIRIEL